MTDFEPLWRTIVKRCKDNCMPLVQERDELEHVFNLMKGCGSYLEIGSAEGNSLYVLSHALLKGSHILSLNIDDHTKHLRSEITHKLKDDYALFEKTGDSTMYKTIADVCGSFDCILIDGGHDSLTVLSDAIHYVPLARKYVFFHDIQLPDVKRAVEFYIERWKPGKYSTFINSETFGYGIIEVGK